MKIRPTARPWVLAATVLVTLTVCHTWPLATDPAHLSRNDNADTLLNSWIVSWVAHQMANDPLALFDANIFHPERRTLALSEPLVLPGIAAMPLRAAGASPILTYNLLLMAGFVLTGLGMFAFVYRLTGDAWAAIFSAALLAFNAHTLTRLPHLQAIFAPGLPLAFWALDRILTGGRGRDAIGLAAAVAAAALTSLYLAVFTAIGLLIVWAAQAPWWRPRTRPILGRLLLAAAIAAALALPVLAPYWEVHREGGFTRDLTDVAQFSGTLRMYMTTAATLHYALWSHTLFGGGADTFFPGLVAAVLAVAGAAAGWQSPARRWVAALVILGACAIVLSLGPATPIYLVLYEAFLPLQAIRGAARFGILVLFAIAVLAGLGLAHLRSQRRAAGAAVLTAAALILASVEAAHVPMPYTRFDGFPRIYDFVAALPDRGAVAELPLYRPNRVFRNAEYVLASTVHWRPLLNGYSGFVPESYAQAFRELRGFPNRRSLAFLDGREVRLLIVHPQRFDPAEARRVLGRLGAGAFPRLELLAVDETGVRLYRLHPVAGRSR